MKIIKLIQNETIKTLVSAVAMGVVVYFAKMISLPLIISMAVSVIVGAITYLIMAIILKSGVIKEGLEIIKSKRK